MKSDTIIKLENCIFGAMRREARAAGMMASIVGVLCDVKPTLAGDFYEDEFKKIDLDEFVELLNELGLKVLFYDRYHYPYDKVELIKNCYVSKDIKLAKQIQDAFNKLWSTMDDAGQIIEPKGWKEATRETGKLLGYPKTAIDGFINGRDLKDEDRVKIMKRNRYYAHSIEYEEEEYRQYDRIINIAVSKYAPKTTDFMTKEKEKRWL